MGQDFQNWLNRVNAGRQGRLGEIDTALAIATQDPAVRTYLAQNPERASTFGLQRAAQANVQGPVTEGGDLPTRPVILPPLDPAAQIDNVLKKAKAANLMAEAEYLGGASRLMGGADGGGEGIDPANPYAGVGIQTIGRNGVTLAPPTPFSVPFGAPGPDGTPTTRPIRVGSRVLQPGARPRIRLPAGDQIVPGSGADPSTIESAGPEREAYKKDLDTITKLRAAKRGFDGIRARLNVYNEPIVDKEGNPIVDPETGAPITPLDGLTRSPALARAGRSAIGSVVGPGPKAAIQSLPGAGTLGAILGGGPAPGAGMSYANEADPAATPYAVAATKLGTIAGEVVPFLKSVGQDSGNTAVQEQLAALETMFPDLNTDTVDTGKLKYSQLLEKISQAESVIDNKINATEGRIKSFKQIAGRSPGPDADAPAPSSRATVPSRRLSPPSTRNRTVRTTPTLRRSASPPATPNLDDPAEAARALGLAN